MKFCIYLFCFTAILSCTEEKVGDIRPLIPGEYSGEMSYWEYNEKTEEFDLNPESFQVSAVISKDSSGYGGYEIEFSKNHLDITLFRFALYALFDSYAHSAFIRVAYGGNDPCPFYFSYLQDEKNGGHFSIGEDRMGLIIIKYFCDDPENSYKIQFSGSQIFN